MRLKRRTSTTAALAALAVLVAASPGAAAYDPTGSTVYQLPSDEPCLKGRGNCAIYGKSAQLPSGRLVLAYEKSTVVPGTGSAAGQTIPVHTSDDLGATWQHTSEVGAPAAMSDDPAVAQYTSAWTNPYLYVLPEDVGDLTAGTLLLAAAVSGDDAYYLEKKAADPGWVPTNDGDRADLAIALYASPDEGETWELLNIVATGGWQGGAAGATGTNVAAANVSRQVDPVWEPYLMVYEGRLVAYYSDENDHLQPDPVTGAAVIRPDNASAADSHGQVLVHRTWDGTSAPWTEPVVDVTGLTETVDGAVQIGGGRPGMTNVVPTTDGRWMLTFEYFGGGADTRFKIADDPLSFFADGQPGGREVTELPVEAGSRTLARGGSPVLVALPDGRLVYNASGSGSVWVNETGRSDGTWTERQTPIGGGYSRTLQHVAQTGRLVILQSAWGGPTSGAQIRRAEVDLGRSAGAYYHLTNPGTGLVVGTGGSTTDASIGNADVPDVVAETPSAGVDRTQQWHLTPKDRGTVSLLNGSGGRAAAVWTGSATPGQRIGQWVDDQVGGSWTLVPQPDGTHRVRSSADPSLFLTAPATGGALTLQTSREDGSQVWSLDQVAPEVGELAADRQRSGLVTETVAAPGAPVTVVADESTPAGELLHAGATARAYGVDEQGEVRDLGAVVLDADGRGVLTLPADVGVQARLRVALAFDTTALLWDELRVAEAVPPTPEPSPGPTEPVPEPSGPGAPPGPTEPPVPTEPSGPQVPPGPAGPEVPGGQPGVVTPAGVAGGTGSSTGTGRAAGSGSLAATGGDVLGLVALSGLVVLGGAVMVLRRRRVV